MNPTHEDIEAGRREIGVCSICGVPWHRVCIEHQKRTKDGWEVTRIPAGTYAPGCWCRGGRPVKEDTDEGELQ